MGISGKTPSNLNPYIIASHACGTAQLRRCLRQKQPKRSRGSGLLFASGPRPAQQKQGTATKDAERSEAKWACPAAPRANKAPKPLHFSRSCATICVVSSCPGVRGPRRGLLGCGQTGAGLRGRREGCRRLRRAASSPAAGRPLPPRSAEANLCRACPLQHSERRGSGFAALPAQFGWNRGAVFARLN